MKDKIIKNRLKILAVIILVMIFVSTSYLFIKYCNFEFTSDFHDQISYALDGEGYSIIDSMFRVCYKIFGSLESIAIMMSILIMLTIFVMSFIIDKLLSIIGIQNINKWFLVILSSSLLFICKLCIPDFSPYYYLGSYVTQPWHNSTYIVMRIFSLFTVYLFYKIQKNYLNDNKPNLTYLLFTISLLLTNYAKPSFIICFAPMMLIYLIIDFIKTKTKNFKNAIYFGVCVLISSILLIFQYKILFPADNDNYMTISIAHAIDYFATNIKYPLYFILNYAFAIVVTILVYKYRKQLNKYSIKMFVQTWVMQIIGFTEWLILIEVGFRATHNNFIWGLLISSLFLFIMSLCMLIQMRNIATEKEQTIAKCVYLSHIIFGICYFGCLFFGYWPFDF